MLKAAAQPDATEFPALPEEELEALRLAEAQMDAGQGAPHEKVQACLLSWGRDNELTVVPPYVIRYRLRNDTVEILGVRHGARVPTLTAPASP